MLKGLIENIRRKKERKEKMRKIVLWAGIGLFILIILFSGVMAGISEEETTGFDNDTETTIETESTDDVEKITEMLTLFLKMKLLI